MRFLHFFLVSLIFLKYSYTTEPEIWSESAILVDFTTEQILFEKNIDNTVAPASMTKIVNLFMVYDAIGKDLVDKNDRVKISERADYRNLPRDSSLMFVEQGQMVTIYELMLGLSIPSGNDAAIAIAEHIYGSMDNYLTAVNSTLKGLGFKTLSFVDASGYDDNNQITVREFAEFCILFIKKYPESLTEVFNVESFTYPKKSNGISSIGSIKQYNHNKLVGVYPGLDGLKTGFINKSGMNISITAVNSDRRVVAVLSGVRDSSKNMAELKRFYDATTLLNYAFFHFENVQLSSIELPHISIKGGIYRETQPIIPYNRDFTLSKSAKLTYEDIELSAPINFMERLSTVKIEQGGYHYNFPIYSNEEILLKD